MVYQAKNWTQGHDPALGDPWVVADGTTTPPTTPPTNSGGFIQWEAGVSQVADGDKVTHAGKCFIAKNGPGMWETPLTSNHFWDEIACK